MASIFVERANTQCYVSSRMNELLLLALATSGALLWAKFFWAALIQARQRLSSKEFQYPEDAAHWGGSVAKASEAISPSQRAQNMLRNDSESQPYFFLVALLCTLTGAYPQTSAALFISYAALRWLHGCFFMNPKQPHRNLAFSASLVVQLALWVLLFVHLFAKGLPN